MAVIFMGWFLWIAIDVVRDRENDTMGWAWGQVVVLGLNEQDQKSSLGLTGFQHLHHSPFSIPSPLKLQYLG
jgi:hypothetical protein